MKINDAHCHYGRESFFGSMLRLKLSSNNTSPILKGKWDKYGVEKICLFSQPYPVSFERYVLQAMFSPISIPLYSILGFLDERLFLNADYSETNESISKLNDERIEFVPFVNSRFEQSDLENYHIKGVKYYEPYGPIPKNLLEFLNENELNIILHLSMETKLYPEKFLEIVEENDSVNFQVAHCADGVPEIIEALDEYPNLFVDTSACSHWIYSKIPFEDIAREHTDKLLFGSDEPWTRYAEQINQITKLDLSETDIDRILYSNYSLLWA